jgi:uncharacterized protein YkwD
MPVSRPKQAFAVALAAIALLWPVFGDRVQAMFTPDRDGCAHSSDLPDPARTAQARRAVLCLLNQQRVAHDLPPLVEDGRLQAAAQAHAEDMGIRNFYAHRNPDGIMPHRRIRAAGYDGPATGENIHWGIGLNATPARIVEDWMNSPGHRANILRITFTRVGTGIAYDAPEPLHRNHVGVYVNTFGG